MLRALLQLNERYDPNNQKNIVRLLDYFEFQNHLCLVFELLSINLYELLKQNQFRGLPLPLIRHFIKQILEVPLCASLPFLLLLKGRCHGSEGLAWGTDWLWKC